MSIADDVMSKSYIGLGSNLGQSEDFIISALDYLSRTYAVEIEQCSSLYRSKPLDNKSQPDYINAVAKIVGEFTALELLDILQAVENYFGRTRNGERWASRTLDLDILLFNNVQIDSQRLIVPHAGILQRDFVLYPLMEIAPNLEIPGFGPISQALIACENRGLEKIHEYHRES